jgi:hypothetical protein
MASMESNGEGKTNALMFHLFRDEERSAEQALGLLRGTGSVGLGLGASVLGAGRVRWAASLARGLEALAASGTGEGGSDALARGRRRGLGRAPGVVAGRATSGWEERQRRERRGKTERGGWLPGGARGWGVNGP